MGSPTLAAIGVLVQGSSALLLLLLFLRLSRVAAQRPVARIWAAAWAALMVSISGPVIHAIGVLLDDPTFGAEATRWLDLLNIPGALLFAGLAAFGVFRSTRARAVIQQVPVDVAVEVVVVEAVPRLAVEAAPVDVGEWAVPVPAAANAEPLSFQRPLPAIKAAANVRRQNVRTATLPLPPLLAHGKLGEVLLIDDEAAVRSTLARIFQRGGWPVRDVSTGEEALAWLLDVPVDDAPAVILCDFKMPGMGGQDVYAHLMRERPGLVSRIVFVTGDTSRESARTFIAGTPCQVVEKPFTVSEIAGAVEEVLAASLHGIG
jgi:CheY-like chemotaxis protein